jgi:hypothetical protein
MAVYAARDGVGPPRITAELRKTGQERPAAVGGGKEVAYASNLLGAPHQGTGGVVFKKVVVAHRVTLPSTVYAEPGFHRNPEFFET